jgi:hypothetical protein
MTQAPERIVIQVGYETTPAAGGVNTAPLVEYVRLDVHREALMQSMASDGQAQEAYEKQQTLEAENAALRSALAKTIEAVNQSRLAFAGYVSVRSATDLIDALAELGVPE